MLKALIVFLWHFAWDQTLWLSKCLCETKTWRCNFKFIFLIVLVSELFLVIMLLHVPFNSSLGLNKVIWIELKYSMVRVINLDNKNV